MVSRTDGIKGFVKNPLFFFELSGEHPEMALQEALSCISIFCDGPEEYYHGPGFLMARFPMGNLEDVAGRLALTHRIGIHMGTMQDGDDTGSVDGTVLDEGSFSVRVKRYDRSMPDLDSRALTRGLGAHLGEGRKVDLENPENEVRAFISSDINVHLNLMTLDRKQLDDRRVAERPFFSPISLHPRYARALINILGVKEGERLLDPFCGTGGILIEAASMGIRAMASDIDPEMIEGTVMNMEHFHMHLDDQAVLDVADIASRFPNTDAIVTDPPYGRSASTKGEEIESLYRRMMGAAVRCLKEGGRLGIVVPRPLEPVEGLILEMMFTQKVHGSLTRYYHVFRRS